MNMDGASSVVDFRELLSSSKPKAISHARYGKGLETVTESS